MEMSNQGWLIFQSYTVEVPLRKIEIQTETACHDLFSLLLVCMAITRYKLHFERVLRIFWGISPALTLSAAPAIQAKSTHQNLVPYDNKSKIAVFSKQYKYIFHIRKLRDYVLALQWGKPFDLPKYAQRKCAREYPNCLFFS